MDNLFFALVLLVIVLVNDFLTDTSSVPSNYVFDQILSPLAIQASKGIYDDYYELAEAILTFAKNSQILPYDQTLGGRYVEYLSSFESYPEDSPESIEAQRMIDVVFSLYDHFCTINEDASVGAYYTNIVTRDETTVLKANLTSFSTGVCKDAIVCLSDVADCQVTDVGGGSGGILNTFQRMDSIGFTSYVNIDLQPNDPNGTFVRMVDKFTHEAGSLRLPVLEYKQQDMNDYLLQVDLDSYYFSVHSYYYMSYALRDRFNLHRKFTGVVHVSNLLFDGANFELDHDTSLFLNEHNKLTGTIGEFKVVDEAMVFLEELPNFYPARFLNSLRSSIMQSNFVSRSLVFWSPYLNVVSRTIAGRSGSTVFLHPTNGFTQMRRTKIYEIDEYDFYFLSKMGYYLSGKIDGLCGYLTQTEGVYHFSLRDGLQFILLDKFGANPNFGVIHDPLNVELLLDPGGGFQIWFISIAPPNYPDSPSSNRIFWRSQFSSWSQTIETAKHRYAALYFKDYLWVSPTTDTQITLPEWPPLDGLVLNDPYGYFHGFWKPYRSADVYVHKKIDSLFLEYDGVVWDVIDPKCMFINPGIYEVIIVDGKFSIIQSRFDKVTGGDPPFIRENKLFERTYGKVFIPRAQVDYHFGDYFHFYNSYGENYRATMCDVSKVVISKSDARVLYDLISDYLIKHFRCYDGYYRVCDWIASIRQKAAYDPQRLWSAFIHFKLIDVLYPPFEPFVKNLGGEIRAVLKLSVFGPVRP
jgi:hypothetical protein